jgi:outer membrane protein X
MLKKVFLLGFATLMAVASVFAQEKGDKAAGAGLSIGTGDSYTNIGIGAKFQYNVTNPIRLEGAFTYFLEKDLISMWDFSVYGHYLFPIADKITVYPLAGLGFLGTSVNLPDFGYGIGGGSASHSDFAFTLGGGVDYAVTEQFSIYADLKYKMADYWDRALISAGVTYKF